MVNKDYSKFTNKETNVKIRLRHIVVKYCLQNFPVTIYVNSIYMNVTSVDILFMQMDLQSVARWHLACINVTEKLDLSELIYVV